MREAARPKGASEELAAAGRAVIGHDAPAKRRVGAEALSAWNRAHAEALNLSAVTVTEIEAGIWRAARIGAGAKAGRLRLWRPPETLLFRRVRSVWGCRGGSEAVARAHPGDGAAQSVTAACLRACCYDVAGLLLSQTNRFLL